MVWHRIRAGSPLCHRLLSSCYLEDLLQWGCAEGLLLQSSILVLSVLSSHQSCCPGNSILGNGRKAQEGGQHCLQFYMNNETHTGNSVEGEGKDKSESCQGMAKNQWAEGRRICPRARWSLGERER